MRDQNGKGVVTIAPPSPRRTASGEEQLSRKGKVKQHLWDLASRNGNAADPIGMIRAFMADYSETGVSRPSLNCQVRPWALGSLGGEWFIPADADNSKRILYVHGGAWIAGSIDTHRHLIDAIAQAAGRPTLAIDYRLAPEDSFPAGLEDCAAALAWVIAHDPYGRASNGEVALIGDSAGGNLAAAATLDALERNAPVPSSVVLLSPVLDARPSSSPALGIDDPVGREGGSNSLLPLYRPDGGGADDFRISPITAPDELLARFPRTLIQASSDEYLRDEAVAFARALWDQGRPVGLHIIANMPHVFQLFTDELPEARMAIHEIASFLAD
ncbi:alpha/beta hydrolase [Sphingomonas bacterium]|uniref:alpha/beta hydrolase n=1 Tax=Sphingomonas bacterium TaxID=1895847 RepID=UPI001575F4D8|nr:alpha/beta hydrolase [Sphingomonas bacterium]